MFHTTNWLTSGQAWPYPIKSSTLSSSKDIESFLLKVFVIKESCNLIGQKQIFVYNLKLCEFLSLLTLPVEKVNDIQWSILELLSINESCNVIGWGDIYIKDVEFCIESQKQYFCLNLFNFSFWITFNTKKPVITKSKKQSFSPILDLFCSF